VATFSQISLLQCSGTVFTLPLGRDAKVGGNLHAKIGCYNVQEQCSRCHTEEKQICVQVDKISCVQGKQKPKKISMYFHGIRLKVAFFV
jgi:hypothetical protein